MADRRDMPYFICTFVLLLLLSGTISGQTYRFGQNKVRSQKFNWEVLRTTHFDVHYYSEEMPAREAAWMAERGYACLSGVFQHQVKKRIPLILYASLNDFQQTNSVAAADHGMRAMAESRMGRVVLPITGSCRELNHMLVHELVHVFQFDILLDPENPAVKAGGVDPPRWVIEGMAEYLAAGMDNAARTWVRAGLLRNSLPSVDKLNTTFDFRAYRLGQSVWAYLSATFGKQKVGEILKTTAQIGDVAKAIRERTGLDAKGLTTAWHKAMREQMLPTSSCLQDAGAVASRLTKKESMFHRMNVAPAISPDGRKVAYVTDKNLSDDIYLLEVRPNGGFTSRRLVRGRRSTDFETLRFFETSLNWSRDGKKIAFVSKSSPGDAICIVRAQDGKQVRRLVFDDLDGLLSPCFSPAGDQLVFAGISGGIANLYTVALPSGRRQQLTAGRFAAFQPQWSPDGKSIAFITDREGGTATGRPLFGDYDLALCNLETRMVKLLTRLEGDVTSPQWSPNGREIAFVAEHQGIPNIYKIDVQSGDILPVTFLKAGVSGITTLTPALSWAAEGRYMAFSTFEDGAWQIYRMALPSDQSYQVDNDAAAGWGAAVPGLASETLRPFLPAGSLCVPRAGAGAGHGFRRFSSHRAAPSHRSVYAGREATGDSAGPGRRALSARSAFPPCAAVGG